MAEFFLLLLLLALQVKVTLEKIELASNTRTGIRER